MAVERLRAGQTGARGTRRTIKPAQLREAALDVKIWLVALIMGSAYVKIVSVYSYYSPPFPFPPSSLSSNSIHTYI